MTTPEPAERPPASAAAQARASRTGVPRPEIDLPFLAAGFTTRLSAGTARQLLLHRPVAPGLWGLFAAVVSRRAACLR
ncbi:hypothetical protein LAJ19_04180 [Deinococcus taeanensis]|uniref:hypothetical protein n=1 Tax=Deinococcus taeanensis TaxID=2737050 RepID=UPI001CDB8616|nr:hypothetical protein [Deinococcus taeanensis]UBV43419.1 hypothetical protein LAJ19_04180 [Deinococcus taeanensis]